MLFLLPAASGYLLPFDSARLSACGAVHVASSDVTPLRLMCFPIETVSDFIQPPMSNLILRASRHTNRTFYAHAALRRPQQIQVLAFCVMGGSLFRLLYDVQLRAGTACDAKLRPSTTQGVSQSTLGWHLFRPKYASHLLQIPRRRG
jgi:hypothetical protein